jgi:hypothetical protein
MSGSRTCLVLLAVAAAAVTLTPASASAQSGLGYSAGRPSTPLGQPGRTLGHPTTELGTPLRRPAIGAGAPATDGPRRPASLSPAPRGQDFIGSGGVTAEGGIPGGSHVALTYEQRGKIRAMFASKTAPKESTPPFKLIVGAKVPQSVRLEPMPQEAVNLVPRYKDYDYTIVKDRIVVVERSTREIDTMIPR